MKLAYLLLTASTASAAWTLKSLFESSPLSHFRINGNELIDLVPEAFTTRIENAVNELNEMTDAEIPDTIKVAANHIQSMMDHMEDEKNVQQMQEDFDKKMGD